MGVINVLGIVVVVLVDGTAIYGGALAAYYAEQLFTRSSGACKYSASAASDRADAWRLIAAIGLLVLIASAVTGEIIHATAPAMVWVLTAGATLMAIGMSAGEAHKKAAARLP